MENGRIRVALDGIEGLYRRQLSSPQINLILESRGRHNIEGSLGTTGIARNKAAKFFQCVLDIYI
jgi:hypothetical protein